MTPYVYTQILASAVTGAGSYVYSMQGIDRASLQLNATLASTYTDVVTLSVSNDGLSYSAFSTNKTITFTNGTLNTGLFDLGSINYVFLKVSWAAPSASTMTLQGVLNAIATQEQSA